MEKRSAPHKYSYKARAEQCFRSVLFASLASTDGTSVWNSPLWLVKDEEWNLYFRSKPGRTHMKNIEKNSRVAVAIYDSKQIDSIAGLQISGNAEVLLDPKEIDSAMKYYHPDEYDLTSRIYTDENAEYNLVKITPDHIYIFDQEAFGDKRVEIPLAELTK